MNEVTYVWNIQSTESMKEDVDDIVEFTECLNEFEAYLYQGE